MHEYFLKADRMITFLRMPFMQCARSAQFLYVGNYSTLVLPLSHKLTGVLGVK